MILAIDVDYRISKESESEQAAVAGVIFERWDDAEPIKELIIHVNDVAPYVSGQFYKRELPCILSLLNELPKQPDIIVVDGYVLLSDNHKGLGAYLFEALHEQVIIIGVAKNPFQNIAKETELFRGKSKKPLYITALGISQKEAKQHIKEMHGDYRFPSLLKKVDTLCRSA